MTNPNSALPAPNTVAWRLHTVMSERGIRTAAELHRRLQPYGIDLTIGQVTRIVASLPTRLNTQVLAALMQELQCDANALLQLGGPPQPKPPREGIKRTRTPAHPSAVAPGATPANVLGPGVSSLVSAVRRPAPDKEPR